MIYLSFPWWPMSINALYMTIRKRQGRVSIPIRTLTPEGRRWKRETTAYIVKKFQPQLLMLKPDVPYVAYYSFITPELQNKTWPNTAKTRYKRVDATNLVKALEDVIVDASAVDDSNYIMTVCDKRYGPTEETRVRIWNVEEEGSPFYAAALSL